MCGKSTTNRSDCGLHVGVLTRECYQAFFKAFVPCLQLGERGESAVFMGNGASRSRFRLRGAFSAPCMTALYRNVHFLGDGFVSDSYLVSRFLYFAFTCSVTLRNNFHSRKVFRSADRFL